MPACSPGRDNAEPDGAEGKGMTHHPPRLRARRLFLAFGVGILLVLSTLGGYRVWHHDYYEAVSVTGATPIALYSAVPAGFGLTVAGDVKQTYVFGSAALRAFAATRVRTKEVSAAGKFEGDFIYLGLPVFHVLEGIAPAYPRGGDNPLDFLVTFEAADGRCVHFSYGELMMADDALPVTLAYSRVPLVPPKEKEKPDYRPPGEMLSGFRLIVPREPDTGRYLDQVTRVLYRQVRLPAGWFPERRKGERCVSDRLVCVEGGRATPAVTEGLETVAVPRWVRVGHGRGFLGLEQLEGYPLRAFLGRNFPGLAPEDWLMLVACDGYRVLYAAREILLSDAGAAMLLVTQMNGQAPPGGRMLACLTDYYADRGLWGVTHVVRFRMPWDDLFSPAKLESIE